MALATLLDELKRSKIEEIEERVILPTGSDRDKIELENIGMGGGG